MFKWAKSKTKDSSPSTKQKSKTGKSSGGMPGVQPQPASHKLDIKAMNFGKFAYRKDDEYKALKPLMENYNANNSPANEIKLIEAAYKYLDAHSTKEVEEHKGRCANVENIIVQLTMKDSVKQTALDNITNLSNSISYEKKKDTNDDLLNDTQKQNTRDAIHGIGTLIQSGKLKEIGEGAEKHDRMASPMLQAVMTEVMSDANKVTDLVGSTSSDAKRTYDDAMQISYKDVVTARSNKNLDDTMSSMAHEFTHVSVGNAFQNTATFFAHDKTANENEILSLRDDREQRLKALSDSKSTVSTEAQNAGYNDTYVNGRVSYAKDEGTDKAYWKYIPDAVIHTYGKAIYGILNIDDDWKTEIEMEQNKGGMKKIFEKLDEKIIEIIKLYPGKYDNLISNYNSAKNDYQVLAASNQQRYDARDPFRKQLNELGQEMSTLDENSEAYKAKSSEKAAVLEQFMSLPGNSSSNTLVEYDAVINQMLMEYEMKTDDRSSLHYRKLKSAAAGAHVRRHIARLQQTQGTQETEAETVAQPQAQEEKPDFMSDEIGTLAKTMGAVSPNTDDPKLLAVGLRKMFDAMKDEKDADEKERRKNNLKTYMKQCGYSSTSWVDTY